VIGIDASPLKNAELKLVESFGAWTEEAQDGYRRPRQSSRADMAGTTPKIGTVD